jgi:hypothetical protein
MCNRIRRVGDPSGWAAAEVDLRHSSDLVEEMRTATEAAVRDSERPAD